MGPWQAVMLGVIQGVTEFLPVSSSGHLVIFQHLFGLKEPELFFDVSVHLGTLVAVIIFFGEEIRTIVVSIGRFLGLLFRKKASVSYINENADLKLAFLIIIGSIPTVFLGLLFHRIVDQLFSSVVLVGMMLLVTGSLLWGTRWIKKEGRNIAGFSVRDALFIGLMQGVAIMPGISRSGSTIAAGLFAGLNRETAARYSFLLFIPAVLGAEILSLKDLPDYHVFSNLVTLLGAITSGIVGYGALGLLLRLVKQGRLYFFAPYCWLAGMVTLILGW